MPPLTVENSGSLVDGGISENGKEKSMQQKAAAPQVQFDVEVAFYFNSEVMEVGKRVTLPRSFVIEMQSANRGKIVREVAAPVVAESATAPNEASAPAKGASAAKEKDRK